MPNTQQCMVREQDQYMPIANVIRIMRRILPAQAKISDDAKETVQECVSEYISFITGEANDRCQREQRKTITAEDVLFAMGKLGFDDYIEPLTLYLNRFRESENERTAVRDHSVFKRSGGIVDYEAIGMHSNLPLPFSSHQSVYDAAIMGRFYREVSEFDGVGFSPIDAGCLNTLDSFDPLLGIDHNINSVDDASIQINRGYYKHS